MHNINKRNLRACLKTVQASTREEMATESNSEKKKCCIVILLHKGCVK